MISAADLNQRVNIEQRTSSQDELGQPIESWVLVAAVWASVKHQSGLSAIKGDADVSTVKASIRIRYRTGIDAGMRVVCGSDIYDIRAILPNRVEGFSDLVCEATK
jgi:SPP1 family predicted phage head-tail adaptor